MLRCKEKETRKHMKKNTKNKISQIDKILMNNEKQNIITAFSMILLAIFAPLKSFVAQWLIDSPSIKAIFVSVLIGAAVVAMSHICEYIVRNTFNRMATRSVSEIRGVLCENLKNMSLSQIHVLPMEDWQSAYTNDLKIVCDDYYFGLFNMAMWGSMGLVAVVYMAVISPALLIVSLVMVCFPFIGPRLFADKLRKTKSEYAKSYNTVCSKINEMLHGTETLLTCGKHSFLFQKMQRVSDDNMQKDFDMKQTETVATIITSLITWIPGFVIMVAGAMLVVQGKLTVSYLITANGLLNFIISPFRQTANSYQSVKSARAVKDRIDELLAQKTSNQMEKKNIEITSIDIKKLSFGYGESDVLKDVNLTIKKGEKVAIVGASGSGKSTIMKLIGRFYLNYRGRISINNEDLKTLSDATFYSSVGYIPQEPFIFADTVRNNICLGRNCSDEEVWSAIEKVGLTELVSSLPDGINTELAEGGGNISGGQKKRIAVARALIRDCDTLLIDEMTSSLDIETTDEMVKLILSLSCTVIMITHDIFDSYMDGFSAIYYIENGGIAESGTYQRLLEQNGNFAKMQAMMKITNK